MSLRSIDYAMLSDNSYLDSRNKSEVTLEGVRYSIIDREDDRSTGFQAVAYRRDDTRDVIIAYRGTEFDREPGKDGLVDAGMVIGGINAQERASEAFTARVLRSAIDEANKLGNRPNITVTGHSLGGTLAEINAARFGLKGETFNAYGAAGLGLRIPEGGHQVVNHVRAGDPVSAASPHFGEVRVYAAQKDVDTLWIADTDRAKQRRLASARCASGRGNRAGTAAPSGPSGRSVAGGLTVAMSDTIVTAAPDRRARIVKHARRPSSVAVPGLCILLAACGGNMEEPDIKLNPNARMRYEITVIVRDAPGTFDTIEGIVDYRVEDTSSVPEAPFSGASLYPSKQLPMSLVRVGQNTFRGEVFLDRLRDEDYYGKGVCHWVIQAASINLKGRPVTFVASLFRDAIVAQKSQIRFFSKAAYFDSAPARIDTGNESPAKFNVPSDAFSIETTAKESIR